MAFYTDYPVYPTELLDTTDYPDQADDVDYVYDHLVNALRDEIIALQAELGTLPKGGHATVKARLDTLGPGLQAKLITATKDMTQASGDISYTGVGFTPKAIIALGVLPGIALASWGLTTGATEETTIYLYPTNNWSHGNSTTLTLFKTGSDGQDAALKTFDADGFTLTWTKGGTPTGTARLKFLCLG